MMARFLSVCSGIEAASCAFAPLGWQAVGFAEIEKFTCEVLAHHYGANMPGAPLATNGVPNFGDFTTIPLGPASPLGRVDLLCGGTPCQSFSTAGRRGSLADSRGNLSLAYVDLAHGLVEHHGLRNALWENVPGVLSTGDNAFGCFLGGLVGAGDALRLPRGCARWPDAGLASGPRARAAWRILDAQYFGLAQRRRRVFVVADFGNGADPAAVLFERAGVRGNPPARGEAGEGTASDAGACAAIGGTGRGTPIVPVMTFPARMLSTQTASCCDVAPSLQAINQTAVAFDLRGRDGGAMPEGPHETANLRAASGGSSRSYVAQSDHAARWAVRRLTPRECERLQGFADDYTAIPRGGKPASACPDGPRYKALGNSWAVPVVRWIGARIAAHMPSAERGAPPEGIAP